MLKVFHELEPFLSYFVNKACEKVVNMSGEIDKNGSDVKTTPPSRWDALNNVERKVSLKKGYDENGGWYMEFSGQYLGHIAKSIIGISVALLVNFMLGSAAWFSYVDSFDMEAISESLHFLVMITNMMLIKINFLWNRPIVDDLFTAIGAGFFSYGGTIDEKTQNEMDNLITDMRKKKKVRMTIFYFLVWACGLILMLKCVVGYYRFGHLIDGEGGTVIRRQVTPLWFFGVDQWPGYLFTCFICYSAQAWVMATVWGSVLPMIAFFEEVTVQLLLVGIGLRRLTRRAKHVFKKSHHSKEKIMFRKCVEDSLKVSVQHHVMILELCAKLRHLLMVPLMTIVIGSALLLCMQGFVLIEDSVPLLIKISSTVFVFVEVVYTFLFSAYGDALTSASYDIGNQLYLDEWIHFSDLLRPYFSMIKMRCRRPVTISAGGFIEIDLNAFLNVLSKSYSYMNLMLSNKNN